MNGPTPHPPSWAVDAGMPEPQPDETFRAYCFRIGLNPTELLEGLTERTAVVANMRLAEKITVLCPDAWQAHLRWFIRQNARVTVRYSANHRPTL